MIPGHELSGTVVAAGTGVDGFAVDDFVVSGAAASCGTCVQCARGRENLCLRHATVGLHGYGALAQWCAVDAGTCRPVAPGTLSPDAAVGCGEPPEPDVGGLTG